jgi:hypothetical protein
VLLVPICLYLLGEPSKDPSVAGVHSSFDVQGEAPLYVRLVGSSTSPLEALPALAALAPDRIDGPVPDRGLRELESAAYEPELRQRWSGQAVRVKGQFSPKTDHIFFVARYRIQCCAADAIPVAVGVVSKESVAGFAPNDWVEVTGRIAFQEVRPGTFVTILQVPERRLVKTTAPDSNPYIQ